MGSADNDWDELQPEEDEHLDGPGENSGTDFEAMSEFSQDDIGEVDEKYPEKEKLNMSPPPNEHEAMRMVQTFNSIYETSTDLASMMNVVIASAKEVIALGKKKSSDISQATKEYRDTYTKLEKQLKLIKDYLDTNQQMADELSSMKESLSDEFAALNTQILEAQGKYVEEIETYTGKLATVLRNLAQNIDFTSVNKNIREEVEKIVRDSAIGEMKKTFDNFDTAYFTVADALHQLAGSDSSKGLLYEFGDVVDNLDAKLAKTKRWVNWNSVAVSFLLGISLSMTATYIYASHDYEKRLNSLLVEENIRASSTWSKKYEELREASKGYMDFKMRYGLSEKENFGYFDDNGVPYFSFSGDRKPFRLGDRIYVEFGEKKK